MPGVIMMFSLFCLFVIEMYLKAKTGGHSHGGPTGQEISAPMPQGHGGHAHAHAAPRMVRNDTTASLPPYNSNGRPTAYADAYEEKLLAR